MAELSKTRQTLRLSDIEFRQLEESRYEEFRINVNEWFSSSDSNSNHYNIKNYPRLTKDDFKNSLDEGSLMYIAVIKTTNEMVGTAGIEKPAVICDKLTSTLILGSVKIEYRRLGILKLLNDEILKIAKQLGVEKVQSVSSYYSKHITEFLLKNGYTLTGTMVYHKSNYTKNMFHIAQDYFVFNYFEKAIYYL